MKKIFNRQMVRSALMTLAVTASTMTAVAPVSCKLTDEGVEVAPADTTAPTVEEFSLIDDKTISLTCSKKIVLSNVSVLELESDEEIDSSDFDLQEKTEFVTDDSITYSEDKKSAKIALSQQTAVGKNYVFSGIVYDEQGNSLEFQQKFCGFNANPARLIFNEIRTKYDSKTETVEFVEFYVLRGGNTYGLELVSAANGEDKKYSFPSIEVVQGEYITVHCRTLESMAETAIDELEDDVTLSTAKDSCDTGRDLWKRGTDKIISNTDVLVLRDSTTDELKDAVLLSESKNTDWTKTAMKSYAEEAAALGIWAGSTVSAALRTDSATTQYRTLSRKNTKELAYIYANDADIPDYISSSASDWFLTEKYTENKVSISGATPGYENSTNAYAK